MKTHNLYVDDENTIYAEGIGNYFSWYLEYDKDDKDWEVYSMYGKHQGFFKTIRKALEDIEWKGE